VLEQLNTSDLLRRELRDVEHRVSAAPVTLGTKEKVNIFADLWQDLRYALRTHLTRATRGRDLGQLSSSAARNESRSDYRFTRAVDTGNGTRRDQGGMFRRRFLP
jgi:hypothetical protein